MQDSRFYWPGIFRAAGVVILGVGLFGFIVPLALSYAFGLPNTTEMSGNEIYRWMYWVVAWALIFWRGYVMIRDIHDRIIDDMLVVAVICAVTLLVLKIIIALIYVPYNDRGELLPLITAIDTGGALLTIVVAMVAARMNRY